MSVSSDRNPLADRRRQVLAARDTGLAAGQTGYYLDTQEARFRQAFAGTNIGIERQGERLTLVLPGTGMFATDSASLTEAVRAPLGTIAEVLAEFDKTLVLVEGHTDSAGDPDYNQRLSERRALAVAERLAARSIQPERLIVVGLGEKSPVADNATAEGRARNRRVTLTLHPIVAEEKTAVSNPG